MGLKDKRVPHCSEYDKCKYVVMAGTNTKNYYCYVDTASNELGSLGVDHPPKTSPKWCPKRVKE